MIPKYAAEILPVDLQAEIKLSAALSRRAYKVHNISRLDIACDTFGQLSMDKLISCTFSGRYVSRFRDYLVSIGTKERSIIFGAPSSRMRLRIYDKTMERANLSIS